VHHLDLYRLGSNTRELEALGYRDIRALPGLVIVEWPERAGGGLGAPDLAITLEHQATGRRMRVAASTPAGAGWLAALSGSALR
jgi:tRNA threonylcarbamoyladenosine biosynthesis protein TsaE